MQGNPKISVRWKKKSKEKLLKKRLGGKTGFTKNKGQSQQAASTLAVHEYNTPIELS
jgi:hypothetical protein